MNDAFCAMTARARDVVARFDAQGRKTYANAAYERVFGAEAPDFAEMRQRAVAEDGASSIPWLWTDVQGNQRQLGLQFTPELQDDGVLIGWWMVGRDTTDERRLRQRLAQLQEERDEQARTFQTLMAHFPDTVVRYDLTGRCTYANPTFLRLWGLCPEAILGKRLAEFWTCGNAERLEQAIQDVFHVGEAREVEYVWAPDNGQRKYIHIRLIPEKDNQGELVSVLTIGRDVTEHKENQRVLARAESMARMGHWEWDFVHQRAFVSEELCRLFGQPMDWQPTPEQALERSPKEDQARIWALFQKAYEQRLPEVAYTYRVTSVLGEVLSMYTHVQVDYGPRGPVRLRGTTRDITEIKQYETRLSEMTLQDPLTGLPNRTLLNDRLQTAMANAVDEGHIGGLLLLNLDRFKEVNDILGHGHGDHLLVHCGQRLQQLVRTYDTVARLGADEFALLLPKIRDVADLVSIAKKVNVAMAQPFQIGDQPLFVTCSIGMALFPADGVRAHELLHHADSALSEAKTQGRSGYHLYSAELTERARERAQLGIALRRAEPDGQLEVYYQPKVNVADGEWMGAEALLRWNHPTLGLLSPDRFIGLAEENGLIVGMGTWVLTKACLAAQEWNAALSRPFKVAVNLSPVQFRQDDLVSTVNSVLLTTGCEPEWLELEITENLLLDANERVRETLCALRSMGITVAIDDFGTGYSSLAYLKRFPIDVLKIDRTFVRDIHVDSNSTELTKAIVSMGRSLNMQLVAEGVESEAQAQFLMAQGCVLAQGYWYGKPMAKGVFESHLRNSSNPKAPLIA
jgi:diguanylate cyclase (GGDEF)-like protein/PAS domain S-box-containing protein